MRIIHTSDWQIGKVFRTFDREAEAVLQSERVEAISRIGMAAVENGATAVLVAGDIWDQAHVSDRTLSLPLERMRLFPAVEWHLIPGNHDPHTPGGPWARLLDREVPRNVRIHVEPVPVPLGDGSEAWLLPAPLTRRHALGDPTEAMDGMETPPGLLRIGLAHGSIRDFDSDGTGTRNRIATDRATTTRLDYLALGDWHGQVRIDDRTWYSGTPEADRFGRDDVGRALLVELSPPGGSSIVTSIETGRFRWVSMEETVHGAGDLDGLEAALRRLDDSPQRVVLDLSVTGTLSLAARSDFDRRVRSGVAAAFAACRIDDSGLAVEPTADDLDAIDHAGFVRAAADRLRETAAGPASMARETAALALRELWVLHAREEGR
jgi:DNA repair exonuclease SbcCD nuclease subunit